MFPSLEESGLELLRAMLQYDPARRISVSIWAADALSARTCSLRTSCQHWLCCSGISCAWPVVVVALIERVSVCCLQAKEALKHPYFDDLDRVSVDALENPELEAFAEY